MARIKSSFQGIEEKGHTLEWVVDLVRQGCSQLPRGRQLLAAYQVLFHSAFLRDVADDGHNYPLVTQVNHPSANFNGHQVALFVLDRQIVRLSLPLLHDVCEKFAHNVRRFGRIQLPELHPA